MVKELNDICDALSERCYLGRDFHEGGGNFNILRASEDQHRMCLVCSENPKHTSGDPAQKLGKKKEGRESRPKIVRSCKSCPTFTFIFSESLKIC